MLQTLFTGSKDFRGAISKIDKSINAYSSALHDIRLLVSLEARQQTKTIHRSMDQIVSSIENIEDRIPTMYSNEILANHAINIRYYPGTCDFVTMFSSFISQIGDVSWIGSYGDIISGLFI